MSEDYVFEDLKKKAIINVTLQKPARLQELIREVNNNLIEVQNKKTPIHESVSGMIL